MSTKKWHIPSRLGDGGATCGVTIEHRATAGVVADLCENCRNGEPLASLFVDVDEKIASDSVPATAPRRRTMTDLNRGGVHTAIMGLLQELPDTGQPWPQKAQWIEALIATLNVIYPDRPTPTANSEEKKNANPEIN